MTIENNTKSYISSNQVRSARGLLGLTQSQLGQSCGLTRQVIARLEAGNSIPHKSNLSAIQSALEGAGIEFLPNDKQGEGVRFKEPREKK